MKTYHYYFDNRVCRTIRNVIEVKVDTWIHLVTTDAEWLVNPDRVLLVRIETEGEGKGQCQRST